jgi:hypothetical protein
LAILLVGVNTQRNWNYTHTKTCALFRNSPKVETTQVSINLLVILSLSQNSSVYPSVEMLWKWWVTVG